jgi:predicted nucleic-acid-binding Zn-ribbon protein
MNENPEAPRCARCGSEKIIPSAYVTGYDDNGFSLAFDEDPKNFVRKTAVSDVTARVCGECGYAEFYAADPGKLYDAYLRSKGNSPGAKPRLFSV